MSEGDPMLERIKSNADTVDRLAGFFEFDVTGGEPVDELRLASGDALVPIACEGTGGCYLLSGDADARPVLFASSEGQGGLIAANLTEALQLIIGLPYWQDCVKFSAGGSLDEMRSRTSSSSTRPATTHTSRSSTLSE